MSRINDFQQRIIESLIKAVQKRYGKTSGKVAEQELLEKFNISDITDIKIIDYENAIEFLESRLIKH